MSVRTYKKILLGGNILAAATFLALVVGSLINLFG